MAKPKKHLKHYYSTIRLFLLGATLFIFIGHYFLPAKREHLVPHAHHYQELYGYADLQKGKSAYWLDKENNRWACDYKPSDPYGCGWLSDFYSAKKNTWDFTQYDALEIALSYEGPASRLRIFLRNYNPAYTDTQDMSTTKVMSTTFPVEELKQGPVQFLLDEFYVSSWWLLERKMRQRWPNPEFDSITHVGLDLIEKGQHTLKIDRIDLVGRWIKTETLLILILSFWMSIFLIEGLVRLISLYRKAQQDRALIRILEEKQKLLEEENKHLEVLADIDPLTGLYNRSGLRARLDELLQKPEGLSGMGLLLLDIDHFKTLNDRYGHDMGDKVLKAFTALLALNLRQGDVIARFGGEEFLIISPPQSLQGLLAFAEKLRQLAHHCLHAEDSKADQGWHLTVSIGVTIIQPKEEFTTALKRVDEALYKAKNLGRDQVIYDLLEKEVIPNEKAKKMEEDL